MNKIISTLIAHKVWTAVAVLALVGVIGAAASGGGSSKAAKAAPAVVQATASPAAHKTAAAPKPKPLSPEKRAIAAVYAKYGACEKQSDPSKADAIAQGDNTQFVVVLDNADAFHVGLDLTPATVLPNDNSTVQEMITIGCDPQTGKY